MTYKTFNNCLKASFIAAFLLFFQPLRSQQNFTPLTEELNRKRDVLGKDFMALVGGKDSLLFQKEFGDIKIKTVAPIGSSSAWLTAVLVLQLVDEGKLSLDDKVVQYLPVFEKYGKNYITIRQCLSHLTGIQSKGKLTRLFDRKKYNTLDEEVASFAANEIETNPGEAFSYNNMGLNIAGRVLEVVSKKRFDILIKQKLFNPLGMRQTSFTTLDGTAPDPSGGARSTALDYMAFLKMLLNGGKHNGQQILSETTLAELRAVQTANLPMQNMPKGATDFQYALGAWAVATDSNKATALAPALSGTWPVVDFCRGYAFLIFPKDTPGEQKENTYRDLKKAADRSFPSNCR